MKLRTQQRVSIAIALVLASLFSLWGCKETPPEATGQQEALYTNATIYTADKAFSVASVLAVKGQRIAYVGTDVTEAKKHLSAKAKVTDMQGQTIIPGLIDGHMHFVLEGERLISLDISLASKEDILKRVANEAAALQPGDWITGSGWNNELWPDNAWPTKEELDTVAPTNPVVLQRTDRHSLWANSAALTAVGITKDTPNPVGGEILKNASGDVLGILTDTAMNELLAMVPPLSDKRRYGAMLKAQEELFSQGITSVMDAGTGLLDISVMKKAYENNDLKIRLYIMLSASSGQDVAFLQAGHTPEVGLFDNRLTVRAVKITSDGSLGSRSAWLLGEYADRPGHQGNRRYDDEELYAIIKRARDNGLQIGVHAIGDAAVRQSLDVIERVLQEQPLEDHRYRIEHFQIVNAADIARAVKGGVIPAMQAVHASSDLNMAESRVGSEAIKTSYAWRSVIDAGGIIANGSDAPVEPTNPFHGLYASVARTDLSGKPAGGWYPEQKMTREEALRSFTIWAAYAQFENDSKGSLEAGKLADFVVLDRDIMNCPEADIKDTKAVMTFCGGEMVWQSK